MIGGQTIAMQLIDSGKPVPANLCSSWKKSAKRGVLKHRSRLWALALCFLAPVSFLTSTRHSFAETAETRARSVIELNNDGCHKLNHHDLRGALKDFDEAIRIRPDFELAITNRIKARYRLNNYEGVVNDYEELVRIKSEFLTAYVSKATVASAYIKLGLAKQQSGDYNAAVKCFDEAIALVPNKAQYQKCRDNVKRVSPGETAVRNEGKEREQPEENELVGGADGGQRSQRSGSGI